MPEVIYKSDRPADKDIAVHDVVLLELKAKDPKKESWRETKHTGVVTSVSDTTITIILPSMETYDYDSERSEYEDKYYTKISRSSEVEYELAIDKEIETKQRLVANYQAELNQALAWREKFQNSISILGRMARFIKSFK